MTYQFRTLKYTITIKTVCYISKKLKPQNLPNTLFILFIILILQITNCAVHTIKDINKDDEISSIQFQIYYPDVNTNINKDYSPTINYLEENISKIKDILGNIKYHKPIIGVIPSPCATCGFHGKIELLKNGENIIKEDIYFNLECSQIYFITDKSYNCYNLTKESAEYLENLVKEKYLNYKN